MSCSVWESFGNWASCGVWVRYRVQGNFDVGDLGSVGVGEYCSDVAVWGICCVYES